MLLFFGRGGVTVSRNGLLLPFSYPLVSPPHTAPPQPSPVEQKPASVRPEVVPMRGFWLVAWVLVIWLAIGLLELAFGLDHQRAVSVVLIGAVGYLLADATGRVGS
jgi:hypothetical protein